MSLLSFTKCFIGAGGEQAAAALTTAMVNMSPEAATAAELKKMEQDLVARPLSDGFVADDDAAGRQQLLHHAQPEREAEK
jgi:hypothetical protein